MLLKFHISVVLALAVMIPNVVARNSRPVANTTVGVIHGLDSDDGTFSMFLGIPYATVDGSNPFGAAIPNPIFKNGFNAIHDNTRCPQGSRFQQSGSLDCLHLNIYVPKTTSQKPLPVLVFIHGGRFVMGASGVNDAGPRFLISHDVILVSIHYRLTVYGFMCLNIPEVPGNQGLKDQLNALRWVKKNIRAFGGDEESITIFGDSAGGVSVDMQLLHADEGLFHKIITQSGTSLSPWSIEGPDLDAAFKLSNQLGFRTSNISEAVNFLSRQNPSQVIWATSLLDIVYTPCVEKIFPNVEGFMTQHPVNTPYTRATKIPRLSGYNDDERLRNYIHMSSQALRNLDLFNYNLNQGFVFGEKHDIMEGFIRRFYAGDEPTIEHLRRAVIDFDSDWLFVHPTQRSLQKYVQSSGTAYHYVFTYLGGRNIMRIRSRIEEGGANHSDELGYLFEQEDFRETPSPDDQLIIDRITTLWTNFAKYGDPTPTTTELLPVKWLPVTSDRLNYLNITKEIELSTRPFQKRLAFWDFFYETNKEYVRGYSVNNSA